jgi:predicted ATPase/serine phosphatase RsbU (regulator of sigma subunit)
MITLKGYKITEELYNGSMSIIYRAVEEKTSRNVVIKLLKAEYPSKEDIKSFIYEFNIAKQFDNVKGIVQNYEAIDYRNTKAIIMEDFGGTSLEKIIKDKKISLKSFLVIAIKCAEILSEIHKRHIIHKDIKPHNILLNQETGEVKIIDFGISTQLTKETQKIVNPEGLEGTLSYISPEQTGRMNRSIDYRTDIYSLGVTFYELLTKKLPFDTTDPMELVHSHIAKIPEAIHVVNGDVPEMISKIVMKMMEKTAENRYQSCLGIKADLEKCYIQLKDKGSIDDFEIAKNDLTDKFQIPEKLYGREKEINHLMSVFDKISDGGKELVFFSGRSGIGKSALINELHKPIVKEKGYFIDGKYDQFKKNIPYSAIIQAFQSIVKQIITEPEDKLKIWKEIISAAVGNNGQVIIDVIPEIELIIGKQQEVQQLAPSESQNRFNVVFQNFVKVFAKKEHPLVLFIDDLQWADNASLNLLKILLCDTELTHFLFLGAYRDNEVDKSHPFVTMSEDLKKSGISYEDIKLTPLHEDDIAAILEDTLHSDKNNEKITELSQLVSLKTNGNPFFVIEFLKYLNENDLIVFDNGWKWSAEKIKHTGITDNVVELMAGKIKKLSEKSWNIMKNAACIGVKFYIDTLAVVCGKTEDEVFEDLKEAINDGMIIKVDNDAKFVHDRIREAAYSLISEKEQKEIHYKIGKVLLELPEEQAAEDRVFSIANQLNLAKDLLNSEETDKLLEINYEAGKKAKNSNAYISALDYYNKGVELLNNDCWENKYSIAFSLNKDLAESMYLTGKYEESKKLLSSLSDRAKSSSEKMEIYFIEIQLHETLAQYDDAINSILNALKYFFDIDTPTEKDAIMNCFSSELNVTLGKLFEKSTDELFESQDSFEQDLLLKMKLYAFLLADSFISGKIELFLLSTIRMIAIILKEGNNIFSSLAYAFFTVLCFAVLKDYKKCYEFGKLAVKFADKYSIAAISGTVYHLYPLFSLHWGEHIDTANDYYDKSIQYCMESGNLVFAAYSRIQQAGDNLITGVNLDESYEKVKVYLHFLKQINNMAIYQLVQSTGSQPILNFKGEIDTKSFSSSGIEELNDYDEDTFEKTFAQVPIFIGHARYCKIRSRYIFEYYNEAVDIARNSNDIINATLSGMCKIPEYYFYLSLSLIKTLSPDSIAEEKEKVLKEVEEYQKMMKQWADGCPDNFLAKYLLIEAELNSVKGDIDKAMCMYEEAIAASKKYGYINIEAVTNECAAKYYLSRGFDKIASTYMIEAKYCYEKWGAAAKVEQLEEKYPKLFESMVMNNSTGNITGATISATRKATTKMSTAGNSGSSFLDVGTVLKATQTMSSEIEMEKLLSKMIKILIENAGAEKGALILSSNDGKLTIEAEAAASSNEVTVLKSISVDDSKKLSAAIVRYVAKTSEIVILDDAVNSGTFKKEQYIIDNKVKSVICTPIVNQGKVVAILYLENNLSTAAFTPARVETLNVLSSQAAISIENARLIDGMKEKARLQQEMAIAEKIQTSLCPAAPEHDELEITAIMRPAEEVGGDYYDVVTDKDNNTWFAIGDVSGHGVTPGLVMMMAETGFNVVVEGKSTLTPSEAMVEVNRILNKNVRQRLQETHFMTMSFLKYTGSGKFGYAGSHLDIVVWRAASKKCELFKTDGLFLCIIPDITPMTKDFDITLNSGDIMVLYTDGVIESRYKGDRTKLWGMEGLCEAVENSASGGVEAVKDAVVKGALDWCDHKPDDDITMIVIKKK